jgi:hypothetical protein
MTRSGDVLWSAAYVFPSLLLKWIKYVFLLLLLLSSLLLLLLLAAVFVVAVAVIVKISITYPVFSLTSYFFTNKEV